MAELAELDELAWGSSHEYEELVAVSPHGGGVGGKAFDAVKFFTLIWGRRRGLWGSGEVGTMRRRGGGGEGKGQRGRGGQEKKSMAARASEGRLEGKHMGPLIGSPLPPPTHLFST